MTCGGKREQGVWAWDSSGSEASGRERWEGAGRDRGTQEDRKHRAEGRAGSRPCPGVFSFTARCPP